MSHLPTLLAIAGLYLVAIASPGPNFFVITQLSLGGEPRAARAVALGITAGSVVWVALAMAGVAALLAASEWLSALVRVAGAAYLAWLGVKCLARAMRRSPPDGVETHPAVPPARAWRTGIVTSLTNPKAGAFWTGVFSTTFPLDAPPWLFAVTAAMVATMSLAWHLGLAMAFTSPRIQAGYRRLRRPIDALSGTVLLLFGLRLAVSR